MRIAGTMMTALLLASAAPALADVDYAIDLTKPEHHTGKVSILFPAAAGDTLDVKMPAWRTGRYTILNLANGVRGFAATDASGKALQWQKVDKSTWRIRRSPGQAVRVSYEIFANELGTRTRHIDDSHAYLNASGIFMYADAHRKERVSVTTTLPAGWKAFSGMDQAAPGRFTGADWDVLTDSPIEAGPHQLRTFEADGRKYEFVIWGRGNHDGDKITADLKKMVPQSQSIWSGYPFNRYLFIVHATDNVGGATEHMNSTVIQMPRYMFTGERYMGFISTAAHEFVHTWNVKAYRSAAMVPYDYQNENYNDLLWVHEGSTEYFTDHLNLRAGIIKTSDYLGTLGDMVSANKDRPGRFAQSVAEASFDEWISPTDRNRLNNASVNIYSEGAIASLALDLALLDRTGGKVSYRDVHNALYKRYNSREKGFTSADMRAILQELTGQSWDAWWAQYVDAPSDVDFDKVFSPVGLRVEKGSGEQLPTAGWRAEASGGAMKLNSVVKDGAAWNAGFETDDIVVAIDGKRVDEGRWGDILKDYKPGDALKVSFFRRDQLMEKTMVLGGRPKSAPTVVPVAKPSARQKMLFQRWLLVPFPKA